MSPEKMIENGNHWKLSRRPFDNVRTPGFYFQGSEHRESLARLKYLVEDRNMLVGLLTGEIGSGKTFMVEMLRRHCLARGMVVASLENTSFRFEDLLAEIIFQIRPSLRTPKALGSNPGAYRLLNALKHNLLPALASSGRHLVVILDESQEMPRESLDGVKALTNINPPEQNLITVLLVGQPELRDRVRESAYLDQRISMRFHLSALSATEVGPYIRHRLVAAGHPTGNLFSDEAIAVINRRTTGVPREVNRICKLALDRSAHLKHDQVRATVVESIFTDLSLQSGAA